MPAAPPATRPELRRRLLVQREQFSAQVETAAAANAALAAHLADIVTRLEPERLGLYWAMRSEFNAAAAIVDRSKWPTLMLALPFTRKSPREMHYRAWDGRAPTVTDECAIATSDGPPVVPDVVLAPCVGFTADGFRLGYGGGYFDRWMAAHPHVTAVGVAWSVGRLEAAEFTPAAHDQRLSLIVTELGVV